MIMCGRGGVGKNGGHRTVYSLRGDDIPIFLLAFVDKRERVNLSKVERNEFASILPKIAAVHRERRRK